jgi:hypothetical protein
MNRMSSALCLSLSLVAIALAVFLPRGDGSSPERSLTAELERIALSLESLGERLERLEVKANVAASGPASAAASGESSSSPAEIDRRLAALGARMDALDNAETIAQLAEVGGQQLRNESARAVLDDLLDPDLTPEERKERIEAHWRQNGRLSDLVARSGLDEGEVFSSILSVAQDPTLDESTRLKLLSDIENSSSEELREPLMNLARFDASPRVRQQAVRNLVAHASDVDAQDTILAAYREDPNDEVQATAQRRLERVFLVAQEETPGSPITTTLTEADLQSRRGNEKDGKRTGEDSNADVDASAGRRERAAALEAAEDADDGANQ